MARIPERDSVQPLFEAYRVSRRVADRRLDGYDLLEPADPDELIDESRLEEDLLEDEDY